MAQYTDPEMLVFLDESAVDGHTLRRASSWSAAGTPAVEIHIAAGGPSLNPLHVDMPGHVGLGNIRRISQQRTVHSVSS